MTNLNGQSQSKINRLLKLWPRGTVAASIWLNQQGISRQLANSYQQSKWLVRIGSGAFIQSGDHVDWTGGLFALQTQIGMKVHIAAKSALQLQGYAHFIPLGKKQIVWLFKSADEAKQLPLWFKHYFNKQCKFHLHSRKLFNLHWSEGLIDIKKGEFSVKTSCPEKAMMEYLDLIPNHATLEQAVLFMESLRTLRPKMLQNLLENCASIKVKRLFLYLAENENHPWFRRLNLEKIDLGKGKRVIGAGGKYIAKYQLSLELKNN